MFSDGGHCPSNLKLTGGENARQTGQVSRCVVAQLLLKLNPCCCLQRCLQHGLLTTDSIQHLVILLLLSWTFPAPALGLPICRQEALARLVPSKSTDTEVFGWKTVSNPISQESGGCCLSWNPRLVLQYAMAACWEPVTASSIIPTPWLAPHGNELSGCTTGMTASSCAVLSACSPFQWMGRILSPGALPCCVLLSPADFGSCEQSRSLSGSVLLSVARKDG